jgi:hypothetical protein
MEGEWDSCGKDEEEDEQGERERKIVCLREGEAVGVAVESH